MSGRAAPSDLELREKIQKRAFFLPLPAHQSEKRYNRQGVVPPGHGSTNTDVETNEAAKGNKAKGKAGAAANQAAKNNHGNGAGVLLIAFGWRQSLILSM